MSKEKHDRGNTMADNAAFAEKQYNYGTGLSLFDHICGPHWRGEVEVTGFSVRAPSVRGGEWLLVARGYASDGTPMVAFHSALSVGEVVAGASNRIQSGTIKWKVDTYRA